MSQSLDGMTTCRVTIVNQRGLHARAAAKFVKMADRFEAEILVGKIGDSTAEERVVGTSILGLMMLAAAKGSELELQANGPAAQAALAALVQLIADKFDEE